MDTIYQITDPLVYLASIYFPASTAYMIFSLKRLGHDPLGSSVESKWSIDIDLKFFSTLRKVYAKERENRIIPFLNHICFYVSLAGILVLPIIGAFIEAM